LALLVIRALPADPALMVLVAIEGRVLYCGPTAAPPVCGSRTRHALLRDNDPPEVRNRAERMDYGLEEAHELPLAQLGDDSLMRVSQDIMCKLMDTVNEAGPDG
jgi:hypothetical protein